MKQECKDCNKSLEDCTCIEDTIDFPKQALKDAAERYSEIYRCPATNENEYCRHDIISAFNNGAKWQKEQNDTSKVKRVEVIQHSPPYNGRAFTKYNAKDVEIQFQDDGRTLKIFLK
jgi:hypothetical protein